jgi:hypothetical protein
MTIQGRSILLEGVRGSDRRVNRFQRGSSVSIRAEERGIAPQNGMFLASETEIRVERAYRFLDYRFATAVVDLVAAKRSNDGEPCQPCAVRIV